MEAKAGQHPVLPVVMLIAGAGPLLYNGYTEKVQIAGFFLAAVGGSLALLYSYHSSCAAARGAFITGLLFLTWMAVGVLWSVDVNATVNEVLKTAFYLLLYWQVTVTFGRKEAEKLITIIIFTATLVALFGIGEYLFLKAGRIHSTFINPNPLGVFLAMAILAGLGRFWQQRSKLLGAALAINGAALILSYSRGSILAFSGGLFFIFWLAGKQGNRERLRDISILFIITLLLAKIVTFLAPLIQQAVKAESIYHSLIRPETFLESSVEGRLVFWKAALAMFFHRPLTGFGAGSFHDVYFSFYEGGRWYSRYVHNHYLQIMAEIGLPGLMFFSAWILWPFYHIWKKRQKSALPTLVAGCAGAMMAFVLHIFMDFSWDMPAVTALFWLLAACGQVLVVEEEERYKECVKGLAASLSLLLLAGSLLIGAASLCFYLGDRAAAAGNREEAIGKWRLATILNPWNDFFHGKLGWALAAAPAGTTEFAIGGRELKRAIELSPYDYHHASRMAFFEEKNGNVEAAGQLFQKAVALGGFVPSLYFDLGNFYVEAGEKAKASEIWNKGLVQAEYALKAAPGPQEKEEVKRAIRGLRLNLATYYEEQGWYGMAAEQLRRVLDLYPMDLTATKKLLFYEEKGFILSP